MLLPDVKSIWEGENESQYVETFQDIYVGCVKGQKKTAIWNLYLPLHATNMIRDCMSNCQNGIHQGLSGCEKERRQGIKGGTKDQNRETYSSLL